MKRLLLKIFSLFALIFFLFTGCSEELTEYDLTPPSAPRDIETITGDNRVDIFWRASPEPDVAGYNVYVASSYDGKYELIGSTSDTYFVDYDARNGETYYYAVTAYDFNGNESDLSTDVVYDTPRPEGFNCSIFDFRRFPSTSAYSFANYSVVPYNSNDADFFFENDDGTFYLNVWEDTDVQDMGETNDIYDVTQAPLANWVPLKDGENIKYVRAIEGHTYVIWTWDNHFAKVRISLITPERMVFDWAYQTVEGNPELKVKKDVERKPHSQVNKM